MSPTLRRAFSFALFLHVLFVVLIAMGIKYWSKSRVLPVPVGLVVEVTDPLPAPVAPVESPMLDRALAVIPAESRALSMPAVADEVPSAGIPVSPPTIPDQVELRRPVMPEAAAVSFSIPLEGALERGSGSLAVVGRDTVRGSSSGAASQGKGRRPIALAEIMPHYPYGARARGEAGRVVVRVLVSEKGTVESAMVLTGSGHPALDESAVAAAKKARFKPAEQEGIPVPSDMNLQFEFRLEER